MTAAQSVDARRILHIGLGSFHRAHQAAYLNALRLLGDDSWSIIAGNIRPDAPELTAALVRQHGEYTLETVTPAGDRRYERIGSIREVVPFDPEHARLIEVGADPATRIISFTVTEAGYFLTPDNRLDVAHGDIIDDSCGASRRTIYGAVTALLRERRRRGAGKVTLLSCDNLRSNGKRFRSGLLDFLTRTHEEDLRDWVENHTTSPCNMVDRITPRPTPQVAQRVAAATGWADAAPVMSESFIQWVIEDRFAHGRPAWERVGAEMVESVQPYEEAKIRVLNATHSCFAWAGTLIGLRYIHEDVAVSEIRQFGLDYVTHDVIPCLDRPGHPSPIDLVHYRDAVLERFSNPHIQDSNQRVAMDGFSKIPGFIAPTMRDCLALGRSMNAVAMLPALFFVFLERWKRGELPYCYEDSMMDPSEAKAFFATADPLRAFCRHPVLWSDLAGNSTLEDALRNALTRVRAFIASQ